MELTVSERATVAHIKLVGRLDPHSTQQIRTRFRDETIANPLSAVVDLSEVAFITSVGIGMLVDCANQVRLSGRQFVIVSPVGRADAVLRKTGIYTIILHATSLEEALSMADPEPS